MRTLITKTLISVSCILIAFGLSIGMASAQIDIDFQTLDAGPEYQHAFGEIIKLFETENPDIKVHPIYAGWDMGHEKLLVRIAANNAPEVAQHNDDFIGDYYARGISRPLGDYGAKIDWTILFPLQERCTRYEGKHYAIGISLKTRTWVYNVDKFKEAGLDELPQKWPSKKWTWDTLFSYAQRLTTKETYGVALNYPQEPYPWISSCAPEEWGVTSGLIYEGVFRGNEQWCLDVLQWLRDMSLVHKVAAPFDLDREAGTETLFRTGKVAMTRMGSYSLGPYKKNPLDFKWNVGPVPLGKTRADQETSLMCFCLPTGSKHPEAGGKFLSFLLTEQAQEIMLRDCGLIPAVASTAIGPLWTEQPGLPDNVNLTMFIKAMFHAEANMDRFHIAGWYEAKKIFKRAIEPIWTGKRTPKEQMERIKPEIDKALSKFRKK